MEKKILYIEDNEQNLYLVKFILEKNGYRVFHASDGKTGIEETVKLKPDLVLLDIQLPSLDGYEVAKILRSKADLNAIPIVAVSSYAMAGDREKAMEAGCNGYIEKPINPDIFVSQISAFIKN